MILIFGIVFALALWWWKSSMPPIFGDWVPLANCEQDSVASYVAAAKKSCVRITVRGPVPAPAGRLACSGMAGIWLHKSDVDKKSQLMDAYFNNKLSKLPPSQRWNYDI